MSLPERSAIQLDEDAEIVSVPQPAAAPAAATQAVPTAKAERIAMFDAMRVVAALSVVFMHTPQSGPWDVLARASRFGPALFTTAAIILLARSLARKPNQTLGVYAVSRIQRLGLPLLLWSLIYAGFYWVNAKVLGGRNDVDFGIGFLFGGAAIHLWFIPFLLFVGILAFPVLKFGQAHPETKPWLIALLLLGMVASLLLPHQFSQFDRGVKIFVENSIWSLPTAFAGVAIALVVPKRINESAVPYILAIGGAIYVAASYAAYKQIKSPVIQLVKAVGVTAIALAPWSPSLVQYLARFGTLSFGVYLVHLLFVTALRDVGKRYVSPGELWFYPAVVIVSFVLSYACAILFSRHRIGKVLFP